MAKIQGTGSIDFGKIGSILLFVLGLYLCSAVFNFIQGWIMTGITQKVCYQLRKEISEKNQPHADEILREPYLRRGIVPYHQRCRYVGTGTEPEYYHDHYIRCNTDRRACDDAQYFTAYDTYCTCDLTNLHGTDWICDKKSQKYFRAQQEYLGHINGQVEEVYGGHLVIKAFNREKDTIEEFEKTNDILYDSAWKSQFCPV